VYILIMENNSRENTLVQRLNIIKGQINGLSDLVDSEKNCKKVTTQFYAINAGLKKVMELYFKENIDVCIESSKKTDKEKLNFLLKEIIKNK